MKPVRNKSKREKALDKLLHSELYYSLQHALATLDNRAARMEPLSVPSPEISEQMRVVLMLQQEAAMGEARWQLHNLIRAFVWELEAIKEQGQ